MDSLLISSQVVADSLQTGRTTLIDISPTSVIAMYAALVSSLSLGWQIFLWMNSKERISIRAETYTLDGSLTVDKTKRQCIIRVVNEGRLAISVTDMYAKVAYGDGSRGETSAEYHKHRFEDGPLLLVPGQCYEWRLIVPRYSFITCEVQDAKRRTYGTRLLGPATLDRW